ncbi:MAG: DUF1572 family protein [Bacteroidota bacterium]|nr:DUF1572 family protein [Bacteroidota bacterium]MXW14429.1 DUF1572 domain-containing protein [Rhodothermaceae bacterium]MDE2644974.1 DUF1572 family protein [Bacteroidota bacterium]MXW33764.1 DUF1572 domain-containing protein [Rhodothermaceae bacterium]MYC03479.1 DUF1572 domain-containing protein [Rhodothermaceae bacterium]
MKATQSFIQHSQKLLERDYLQKIQACLKILPEADLWWRPNDRSNSVGNLLLHLAGNLNQWIVAGVGSGEDHRRRDREFSASEGKDTAVLLQELQQTVYQATQALEALNTESLNQEVTIQGIEVTVLGAIYHAVEHFSMHVGQIIYITKLRTDTDLNFVTIGGGGAVERGWCVS